MLRDPHDVAWQAVIAAQHPGFTFVPLASPWDAFAVPELRAAVASRYVAYRDADSPLAVNNALTAAGVTGAVAVEERDLPRLVALGYAPAPELGDLRGIWAGKDRGLQRWALNHLRPRCHPRWYGASLGTVRGDGTLGKGIDYMVREGMLVWMLATKPEYVDGVDTIRVQEDILATYPAQSVAYGWWGKEPSDIREISDHGHTFVVDGYNHSFTVHLGIPDLAPRPQLPLPAYRKDRAYVTFVVTQGSEAMGYLQRVVHDLWHAGSGVEPGRLVRERVPLSIMFAARSIDLQPHLVAYYAATQTGATTFIDKGNAYANISRMAPAQRNRWLDLARGYLDRVAIKDFIVNDGGLDRDLLEKAAERLDTRSLFTLYVDLVEGAENDPPWKHAGTAIFTDPVRSRETEAGLLDVGATTRAIVASAKRRQFSYLALPYSITGAEIEALFERLRRDHPEVVVVNADVLVRLYRANGDDGGL